MPPINAEYKPNDKNVNQIGNTERETRMKEIDRYWKYYDGDHPRWLKPDPKTGQDENLVINLCERSIDKMTEFVGIPKKIMVPALKNKVSDSAANPIQDELDSMWQEYRYMTPEILQSGLLGGHSFLKLYIEDDGQAAMTLLDPRSVSVFWDATRPKRVLFYRMQWKSGEKNYRQDIVPEQLLQSPVSTRAASSASSEEVVETALAPMDEITGWRIIDYREWGSSWRVLGEQEWPYNFAPIVDWPTKKRAHSYYGVSALKGGRTGLNDGVNFIASNTARIIKHHAHPKTFVFGAELDAKTEVGGFWDGLDGEARVETLEMASDLVSTMNFMNFLRGEFFSSSRVLDTASVRDKLGNLTNFGVRMLFGDQIEAREEITRLAGDGLAEAFRRMLIVNGQTVEGKLETQWADPLPTDRLELLKGSEIESKLGTTSKETLATDIGRNYESEKEKMAEEPGAAGDAFIRVMEQGGQRGLFN